MSRVGRQPIPIPSGVVVSLDGQSVSATGPKGTLKLRVHPLITVRQTEQVIVVAPVEGRERVRGANALWGLTRALVANLVTGVIHGFQKKLELQGVGYRAEVKGTTLVLSVGFSHLVEIKPPEGITFSVAKNVMTVDGIDKHLVGEVAAQIRRVRPPEPYQGKGIRYVGEYVRRKAGKVVGTTGASS